MPECLLELNPVPPATRLLLRNHLSPGPLEAGTKSTPIILAIPPNMTRADFHPEFRDTPCDYTFSM
jgi:hypothetical protein